jgi:acyl-CoA thioester hydrolase
VTAPFVLPLRVRFGECDPQGIVFNAHYLAYCDVAMTELWRASGCPWQEMQARDVDVVLAEANVRFRSPARADDVLELRTSVTGFGTTSIHVATDIVRDGELLSEVRMRHVCLAMPAWEKTPVPQWLRDGLAPFTRDVASAAAPPPAGS